MINWKHRLFHHDDPATPAVRGQDVGFSGRAGRVIINDPYRLAEFQIAGTPRQRLDAAMNWLKKLAANGRRGADELDDPAIEEAVGKALDTVAAAALTAAGGLQRELRKLIDTGGPDEGHRDASRPAGESPEYDTRPLRLLLPQQRDRHASQEIRPEDGEPWPDMPRLRLTHRQPSANDAT